MERAGFYVGANERSAFDILWSCFRTLFFRTRTILRLNMPYEDEAVISVLGRRLKWMATTAIAPEVTTYISLARWLEARSLCRRMNGAIEIFHHGHGIEIWSIFHSFS